MLMKPTQIVMVTEHLTQQTISQVIPPKTPTRTEMELATMRPTDDDGDGISDTDEASDGTDPLDADSDGGWHP